MKSSNVNEYLKQYYRARAVKRDLGRRYQDLSGRSARLAEVAKQIETQRAEMVQALQNVMDMVDLLPLWSMERTVVELRRIDCKPWEQVARDVCMGRSRAIDYYNAALQVLADNDLARALIGGWGGSRVLPGDKIAAGRGRPGIFSHEEREKSVCYVTQSEPFPDLISVGDNRASGTAKNAKWPGGEKRNRNTGQSNSDRKGVRI